MSPVDSVAQSVQAENTQLSFQQMRGEVQQWNPDAPVTMVERWLQNTYRKVIDYRLWYGLLRKGVVSVPSVVNAGTVSLTNGGKTVTGVGTAFTNAMIGRQLRIGFSTPIHTIASITSPTSLELDLDWGAADQSGVAYSIFQNIVSFGPRVKRLLSVVNQRQGFRLRLNMPQEVVNSRDTWRTQTGWTFLVADYVPSSTGDPQWELYPAPTFQQSFPFLAYIQAPDLSETNPFPLSFIRSDVIVAGAIPNALMFKGKNDKYYDPQTAQRFRNEFLVEMEKMSLNDNNHLQKDLIWEFDKWPFTQFGSNWHQQHDSEDAF